MHEIDHLHTNCMQIQPQHAASAPLQRSAALQEAETEEKLNFIADPEIQSTFAEEQERAAGAGEWKQVKERKERVVWSKAKLKGGRRMAGGRWKERQMRK